MFSTYLKPVPVLKTHDRVVGAEVPGGLELAQGGDAGAALGRHEEALGRRGVLDALDDLALRDRDARAVALAQRAQDQEVADRLGHAQAVGVGRARSPTSARRRAPSAKALTMGAQPSACTAYMRGPLGPDEAHLPRSSSKAFHMPMRPVPPPVG